MEITRDQRCLVLGQRVQRRSDDISSMIFVDGRRESHVIKEKLNSLSLGSSEMIELLCASDKSVLVLD
jgi:hypothetical protein